MGEYHQFIAYRVNGKDKIPYNFNTGVISNPHDPAIWSDYETVKASLGDDPSKGVGFVFTKNDPFYFLDIDGCLMPDGTWSPLALELLGLVPGAAIEVSVSGTGLHAFGRGECPPHSCKNTPLHIELYTEGRFVALTGNVAPSGSADVDNTDTLATLVSSYFPPSAVQEGEGWTEEPNEAWAGHEKNVDLISHACRTKSAANVFGDKASFKDLWHAEEDALAKAYPPQNDINAFDHSSADAALAQHLAFWTGGDCERMRTLMKESGLVREKWDREDYMVRTILQAAAKQSEYHVIKVVTTELAAETPKEDVAKIRDGVQFMPIQVQLEHFKGCAYIKSMHRVFCPRSGIMLKPESFRVAYGGYTFPLDHEGNKTTRNAWEAFTETQAIKWQQVDVPCFRPQSKPAGIISEEGVVMVNTYMPVPIKSVQGDVSKFTLHLEKLVPDPRDREIVISYMAAVVQHQGVKFQWCVLLQGVEGNGKTLLTHVVKAAIGKRYTHYPSAADLDNKFNAWMAGKTFIGVEDIYVPQAKQEVMEALKPMITNPEQAVTSKGVDQATVEVCCNFMLNSNHKDGIRKTKNDRRFAVFFTAQQEAEDLQRDGMDNAYFNSLYNWLRREDGFAKVTNFLQNYKIADEFNPATNCSRAPRTTSTQEAIEVSKGFVEQEILEAIESGLPGFCGGWVSSMQLDHLLKGLRVKMSGAKRVEALKSIGYIAHPHLVRGRTNNATELDGGKPILYVKCGSLNEHIRTGAKVAAAYSDAQSKGQSEVEATVFSTPPQLALQN